MASMAQIEKFLKDKKIALVGASANPNKLSHNMVKELMDKGYEVYPVNPKGGELHGIKVYESIADLPSNVDSVYILTNKSRVKEIFAECIKYKKRNIWIYQSVEIDIEIPIEINLIMGYCIIMFINPKGPHLIHKFFSKILSKYPK